jgi:hypothetical protein
VCACARLLVCASYSGIQDGEREIAAAIRRLHEELFRQHPTMYPASQPDSPLHGGGGEVSLSSRRRLPNFSGVGGAEKGEKSA